MSQFIFPPLTASLDSEQSDGGALPSAIMVVGGYDGSLVQVIKTDADGNLQVDVLSSTGPSNYATDTLQTAGNAILTTIDADTSILSAAVSSGQMQVDIVADGAGLATSAKQDTIETTLTAIETDANTLAGAVAGTEMQVDVLTSALPSGAATSALQTTANGILTTIDADTSSLAGAIAGTEMQVDVLTSALPSGAATSALQTTANGILTTIDADTGSIAGAISGSEMQVDIVASLPAGTNEIGKLAAGTATIGKLLPNTPVDFLDAGVFDSSTGTSIPSTGSAVLVTLAADCKEIEVIDDIGEYMSLRLTDGTVKAYLPLGGGRVMCSLSTGNAMKLYSETGTTISSGKIAMNFLA